MKSRIILSIVAAATALTLNSCIQQAVNAFVRAEYPAGDLPHVILSDAQGKPASNNWLTITGGSLPPSSLMTTNIEYGPGNIPYGIRSNYSNVVNSPYPPHYELDYSKASVGSKVWDPYTRKPFYIRRTYTFN